MFKNTKILMVSILSLALILTLYGYFKNKAITNVAISSSATPTIAPVINLTETKEVQPYYGQIKIGVKNNASGIETTIEAPKIHVNTIPQNLYYANENNKYFGLLFRINIDKSDSQYFNVIGYDVKFDKYNYTYCIVDGTLKLEQENPDGTISKAYTILYYNGNKILNQIQSLYKSGGNIEINSILTTVKDGKNEGGFDDNLNEWGKVYHTYDDMIKARAWNKPEQFKQFFDKDFFFKGERNGS